MFLLCEFLKCLSLSLIWFSFISSDVVFISAIEILVSLHPLKIYPTSFSSYSGFIMVFSLHICLFHRVCQTVWKLVVSWGYSPSVWWVIISCATLVFVGINKNCWKFFVSSSLNCNYYMLADMHLLETFVDYPCYSWLKFWLKPLLRCIAERYTAPSMSSSD